MPNWCYADMIIKGRKDSVDEFIRVLEANYSYRTMQFTHKPHFYRIFDVDVYYYEEYGLCACARANIQCAWSVSSCLLPEAHSYYDDMQQKMINQCNEQKKLDSIYNNQQPFFNYGTNLLDLCKKLNLEVEIISEECGFGFMEHIKVRNGDLIINDCVDYAEYVIKDYDTLEDFKNDNPESNIDITADEFKILKDNGEMTYTQGGIPWDFDMCDDPEPDNLCMVEMVKIIDK